MRLAHGVDCYRPSAAECDARRKDERSTDETRGDEPWHVTWTRQFLDHLDQQAAAIADLVDGSA